MSETLFRSENFEDVGADGYMHGLKSFRSPEVDAHNFVLFTEQVDDG